ncbi:MAG: 2'-5' RNA ligase family protein [Burkholderiaceae bacterium]|nr:2'-5' RNA ligase family protein [Burkholderiaceae bacterium]
MQTLYTLAYPFLAPDDAARIEAIRQAYDPRHRTVPPHFTLVFGCSAVPNSAYTTHVRGVCRAMPPLRFVCRRAMPWFEREGLAYLFLVPDEGYGDLCRLHDALNGGVLAPHLRRDIPFVPHITIGAGPDRRAVRDWSREVNRRPLEIAGSVAALTIATAKADGVSDLVRLPLAGSDSVARLRP